MAFFHKIPFYYLFIISSLNVIKAKQLAVSLKNTQTDFKISFFISNTISYELLSEPLRLTYEIETD